MSHTRVLFLESLATISGGQAVLVNVAMALQGPYGLVALLPGEGPLAQALRASGVRCHFASLGSYSLVRKTPRDVLNYGARFPWLTLRTWQIIRREKIDLVYANNGRTFAWGALAAALAGRPILWHHHNLLGDAKSLALLRMIGRLPAVRRILCGSEEARQQFPTLAHKAVVMRNGIDTRRFRPDLALGLSIRQELGIAPENRTVGIVGDLIPLKGQRTLLEAALALPGLCLVVVGNARPGDEESSFYAARLHEMALQMKQNKVIFTGRREDLPAVLNALDLLVIASERETGPLVLLEALACGVPAISTPVGRAPDLLPTDALFPIGDAAALSSRLRDWLSDPQKLAVASSAARAVAEEKLSLEQFQAQLRAHIEDALHAA